MVRFGATNEDGKELIVRDLGAENWFGLIGSFGSGVRPDDAVALTDTMRRVIDRREVEVIGQSDPMLWRAIAGTLAGYAGHSYKTYENAVFLPLEDRLEVILRELCK